MAWRRHKREPGLRHQPQRSRPSSRDELVPTVDEERMELNDAEWRWLDTWLGIARAFADGTDDPVPGGMVPELHEVDAAYDEWWPQPIESRIDANHVCHILGAVIGAHLCRELGLHWVVIRDRYGTELAVVGEPCDVIVYPMVAVAKRMDRGETDFCVPFVAQSVEEVRRLRAT